jgi:hypothetical protein
VDFRDSEASQDETTSGASAERRGGVMHLLFLIWVCVLLAFVLADSWQEAVGIFLLLFLSHIVSIDTGFKYCKKRHEGTIDA